MENSRKCQSTAKGIFTRGRHRSRSGKRLRLRLRLRRGWRLSLSRIRHNGVRHHTNAQREIGRAVPVHNSTKVIIEQTSTALEVIRKDDQSAGGSRGKCTAVRLS